MPEHPDPQQVRPEAPGAAARLPRGRRAAAIAVRALLAAAVTGSLALVFGFATWTTLSWSVRRPEVVVPDLASVDGPDAIERLEKLGVKAEVASRRYDARVPAGRVLDQFPRPGTRTKPGRPVRIVVSLGPERAVIPDLIGSSLRRAQLALHAAGLSVAGSAEIPHPSVPLGRIVAQSPAPGREAFPGDPVSLLVSAGPPPNSFVMPALTGWSVGAARAWLERAGVRRINLPAGDNTSERVTQQAPRPGSRVDSDDRVTLVAGRIVLAAERR